MALNGNIATYTPKSATFSGKDSFAFKVRDGKKSSRAAKVKLAIKPFGAVTTRSDTVVAAKEQAVQIASIESVDETALKLTTRPNSPIGSQLAVGKVLTVLPGEDDRYPLGLAARVSQTTPGGAGEVVATLQPVTLADVIH